MLSEQRQGDGGGLKLSEGLKANLLYVPLMRCFGWIQLGKKRFIFHCCIASTLHISCVIKDCCGFIILCIQIGNNLFRLCSIHFVIESNSCRSETCPLKLALLDHKMHICHYFKK